MNRRYYFSLASVLGLICFVCIFGLLSNAFNFISLENFVRNISVTLCVISGYSAVFFCGLGVNNSEKAQKIIKKSLWVLFLLYIISLVDFTLISDAFGRNILNIFNWNFDDWRIHSSQSTNFIPFATVSLFINGYKNNTLSLTDTMVNLLGNFMAFMPLTFFVRVLRKRKIDWRGILTVVAICVVIVELLQLIFMTGACVIDDLILNLSGAILFYSIICKEKVSRIISKLTFGVWKINDEKN